MDEDVLRLSNCTWIGLLLTCIGIFFLVWQWNYGLILPFGALRAPLPPAHFDANAELSGLPGPDHTSTVLAVVHIDAPTFIHLGDSAVVSLSATGPDGGNSQPDLPQISLSGAGLDVQPEGWISLQKGPTANTLVARWTIRAKESGKYELAINSKEKVVEVKTKGSTGNDSTIHVAPELERVYVFFSPNPVIELRVTQSYGGYVSVLWPVLVTIMGTYITIPGIVLFFQRRKKARQARARK